MPCRMKPFFTSVYASHEERGKGRNAEGGSLRSEGPSLVNLLIDIETPPSGWHASQRIAHLASLMVPITWRKNSRTYAVLSEIQ